ncbi:GntR family transcriptional regulator [Cohaesibacter sp. CAU 1516]|uniref:GntR family transcriptional regulator n=1 Tax=Cohaesibacter sp. CAU 1516 TaxID=2576038 RepID=UPI0010FF3437|nr:GntR family transcriptional regulator [Cohaesibacter sp. CAU 1516]TLP43364.1 GntR family transcriptional regulator [Cohaesibacter sp. CAU 1516]
MAQILRRTTTNIVADELRKRIMSGQLREGEQVRQEAIATELGVSRIPVREALRQLEAEGLITLVSHKGAEVTRLEPSEIAELFEVRIMLESWMFEHAIEHITESHLEAAEKLIASMRNDAMIEEWGALNWQFHETLYTPARKPATMKILRRVHDNIDRYVRLQITLTEDSQERAHREHQAIVDAARNKNAKVAVALLNDHINHVKEQLLANLVSKESLE